MLEAGFTRVGEFHYLHHERDGQPYADPAEMSLRILAAATNTCINLTQLPVFYAIPFRRETYLRSTAPLYP